MYPREKVGMPKGKDRREKNSATADNSTDANLTQRITTFSTQTGDDYIYRIPLRFLSDVTKSNQIIKIDLKIIFSLE